MGVFVYDLYENPEENERLQCIELNRTALTYKNIFYIFLKVWLKSILL